MGQSKSKPIDEDQETTQGVALVIHNGEAEPAASSIHAEGATNPTKRALVPPRKRNPIIRPSARARKVKDGDNDKHVSEHDHTTLVERLLEQKERSGIQAASNTPILAPKPDILTSPIKRPAKSLKRSRMRTDNASRPDESATKRSKQTPSTPYPKPAKDPHVLGTPASKPARTPIREGARGWSLAEKLAMCLAIAYFQNPWSDIARLFNARFSDSNVEFRVTTMQSMYSDIRSARSVTHQSLWNSVASALDLDNPPAEHLQILTQLEETAKRHNVPLVRRTVPAQSTLKTTVLHQRSRKTIKSAANDLSTDRIPTS